MTVAKKQTSSEEAKKDELAEKVAETADKLAEPAKPRAASPSITKAATEYALRVSRERLQKAGQYVERGTEVSDSSPVFAGYDRAADSAPLMVGKPTDTSEG